MVWDENNESTRDSAEGKTILFGSECLLAKLKDQHHRFSCELPTQYACGCVSMHGIWPELNFRGEILTDIVILSSISRILCPHWVCQNPEDVCETYRAG